MANQEMQLLSDIALKVGRLEALQDANARAIGEMASGVNRLVDKLEQSDDIAKEADQRARSAHHRLDRIDRMIFWLGTTFAGGFILAVVTFVVKGGLAT